MLNNLGDNWAGQWVETKWKNVKFKAAAWGSHQDETEAPIEKWMQSDGWGEFFATPRGYSVYILQDVKKKPRGLELFIRSRKCYNNSSVFVFG